MKMHMVINNTEDQDHLPFDKGHLGFNSCKHLRQSQRADWSKTLFVQWAEIKIMVLATLQDGHITKMTNMS